MSRYVVCKRRNIAASFERFLGRDAGVLSQPWASRTWTGFVGLFTRRYSRHRPADSTRS
jgi:hypothetical protein